MGDKYFVLNRQTRRFVAQQLRDQRQIEPLARFDGAVDQLGDQFCHSGRRSIPVAAIFVSLARPIRSAQSDGTMIGPFRGAAASHAASVASAGAANCDETSPWNTDGPTWSSRLSRSAQISPPISVQRLQNAKSSLR